MAKEPNPYVIALFTALLAAGGATLGTYYTAKWQTSLAVREREASCRKEAYLGFLTRVHRSSDSTVSEFLNVGALAEGVSTDSEVQALEDRIGKLQSRISPQDVYVRLNSDLNLLRLCASPGVQEQTDKLLSVLLGDFSVLNLAQHPSDFPGYYEHSLKVGRGISGQVIEERVSSDQRSVIILASCVLQHLIRTMNRELAADTSPASTASVARR
jgi:hypothetical protein